MVADVPVGAFLSGGLDSSSVAWFAQQSLSDRKLQCFTIGFKGKDKTCDGMAEDLPYAQKVAKHIGVDLHTIYVGSEMADQLEKMIWYLDEPQADPAPINVLFISQLAREHGIKVLLSGAGGDDIFTGYIRYELEPFILDFAEFEKYRGKKVLEIGVGLGADHQKFAEAGAELYGIDLTERAVEFVRKRFEIMGLHFHLKTGDAEHLDFPDETFDLVYSWGVIHHTPDTSKAAKEILRVLRGGANLR